MGDLRLFGSSVVNRRLVLLFIISCSLALDTHLTEIPSDGSEDRDDESKERQTSAAAAEEKEKEWEEREEKLILLKPDPCRASITAMSIIREEYHIFSGKWFWRVTRKREILESDPTRISLMWYGLPFHLDQVDAVCERTTNGKIVFFIGSLYWELDDNRSGKFPRSGRPLTELGFANDVTNVDAAFVSPKDNRTYVIAADRLWRMNATGNGVDGVSTLHSLLPVSLPSPKAPIDAVFTTFEGKIHLVQGDFFWEATDPTNTSAAVLRLRNTSTIFGCAFSRNLSPRINTPTVHYLLTTALIVSLASCFFGLSSSPVDFLVLSR